MRRSIGKIEGASMHTLSRVNFFLSYSADGASYAERIKSTLFDCGFSDNIIEINDDNIFINPVQLLFSEKNIAIFILSKGSIDLQISLLTLVQKRNSKIFTIFIDGTTYTTIENRLPYSRLLHGFLEGTDLNFIVDEGSDSSVSVAGVLLDWFKGVTRSISVSPRKPARAIIRKKRPLNEGKLILVGRGEVGKTSLVRRFTADEFRGDEAKTQGINITKWSLRIGSGSFKMNVWDFGGQEIMHATHQFFLTERSLYLLVLNGREGGEDFDAEYWIKYIESFGGESPIIVVQNKIDQHPFELNYRGLQSRYPQIQGFVKTDCAKNIGIDELRKLIRKCVRNMPEIRMPFPVSWFTIKQGLESIEDDFISYDEFCKLYIKESIKNDSDMDTLCWVLHCLGIALNYKDDSRLRETSVLKPEWVTQGIYKILNARTLADRQGELHVKDLQALLPKDKYPENKHHFILELMRKFTLCFPFPEDTDRYLVPELLGKEEPAEAATFIPIECLNIEYQYGILPEGLLPRFIVRSNTLSRGQARWRSGVILGYEDCKALVTAEPVNRKVVVRVKGGKPAGRRSLLAIIRYDLDKINAEFKDKLEVQLKIPLIQFPHVSIDYNKLVALEKNNVQDFPEVVNDRVLKININELLNGVDLEAQRQKRSDVLQNLNALFFSYSHKDEALRDELETHLKLLQRQQIILTWHDRKILPGSEWNIEIDSYLSTARIILLLISADFIASEYCWGKEIEFALKMHEEKKATVIPVILRACDWQSAPFRKLQGLPKDMKPITAWQDRDAAWTDVARGIRAVAVHRDRSIQLFHGVD